MPGSGPPPGPRPAALDVAVVLAPLLAWLAISLFFHPVGDHYTESDFYGAYADGARALMNGHLDPGRYGIYGPGYEIALALVGRLGVELFRGASLLSVLCAGLTLAAWWAIAASALGRGAARVVVLLVAATPVFTRYAYSATTDMPAAALGAWALALLLLARGPGRLALAGALVALAALTRYQALVLLPIATGLLAFAGRDGAPVARSRRAMAFACGFVVIALPWTAFSVSRGFVPGQGLAAQYGFYVIETGARNVQDQPLVSPPAADAPAMPRSPSLAEMIATHPGALLRRLGARTIEHVADDARVLVGPGFLLAALAGAAAWAFTRRGRLRGPLAWSGALLYLGLVPAFYSDRYRLLLIPVYAVAAAALVPAFARGGRAGRALALVAFAAVAVPLALRNVELQRRIERELPRDVLALAPALAAGDAPGLVMSRKGHVGYYARRPTAAFPRSPDVPSLAHAASAGGARYLYYSWYEAQIRPEFLCLLDTTRTLPGLERVAVSRFPPAVLYRIEEGFGDPGWYADARSRAVSEARASIWALSDSSAARGQAVLAADAYLNDEPAKAQALARRSLAVLPDEHLARSIDSLASLRLSRPPRRSDADSREPARNRDLSQAAPRGRTMGGAAERLEPDEF